MKLKLRLLLNASLYAFSHLLLYVIDSEAHHHLDNLSFGVTDNRSEGEIYIQKGISTNFVREVHDDVVVILNGEIATTCIYYQKLLYYEYKDVWSAPNDGASLSCEREPGNPRDNYLGYSGD